MKKENKINFISASSSEGELKNNTMNFSKLIESLFNILYMILLRTIFPSMAPPEEKEKIIKIRDKLAIIHLLTIVLIFFIIRGTSYDKYLYIYIFFPPILWFIIVVIYTTFDYIKNKNDY